MKLHFEKSRTIRFPMLNFQDNKRLTFRHKFLNMNPKDHVETTGCDRSCITYDIPSVHPSRGQKRRPIVVCLYLLRKSTPAAPRGAASMLWKGGGWGCTGISYSPFYGVYSACGWGHETLPAWKLNVTRKRNVTIFRVSAGRSCFVASRLVSHFVFRNAIVPALSRDNFYSENSNSDRRRKVWDSFK